MEHSKSLLRIADNIEEQATKLREVSARFAAEVEANTQTNIVTIADDLAEKSVVLRQLATEVSISLIREDHRGN